MSCEFKIERLSDEFSEVNFCDGGDCNHCVKVQREFDSFIGQRQEEYRSEFNSDMIVTIGISPTPDYISYWKSPEGLVQLIEGLFRGDIISLESVKVFLSFDFKEVKGFTIPMFCLVVQLFGERESLDKIESELTFWSPRICGWLSETSVPMDIDLIEDNIYDYSTFKEFLLEYEYDYLNGLTLLSPIQLNWDEFVGIRHTGVLNRLS